MLYCVGKICFGPLKVPDYVEQDKDVFEAAISTRTFHGMSRREVMTVGPLAVACLVLGFVPAPMLGSMEPAVAAKTAAVKAEIVKLHGGPAAPQGPTAELANADSPKEATP